MSYNKKAVIYKPTKTSTQSGNGKYHWIIEFEKTNNYHKNTLMGWTGSGNTTQQVKMKFDTKESAIRFAEKNALDYIVKEAKSAKLVMKNYSDNFKT